MLRGDTKSVMLDEFKLDVMVSAIGWPKQSNRVSGINSGTGVK
jgi:hypothetical protein